MSDASDLNPSILKQDGDILNSQDELIYTSGRNLDEQFRNTFNIKNVHSFITASEQMFETRKSLTHYPFQYNIC